MKTKHCLETKFFHCTSQPNQFWICKLLAKNIPVVLPSSQSKFEAKRVQKGSLVIVGHANKQTDRQIKMISLWI